MHKILVEDYNPASNETYDIFVPLKSKMHEVTFLIANAVSELSKGNYKATKQSVLVERTTGEIVHTFIILKERLKCKLKIRCLGYF
jgi:hypothetical protein